VRGLQQVVGLIRLLSLTGLAASHVYVRCSMPSYGEKEESVCCTPHVTPLATAFCHQERGEDLLQVKSCLLVFPLYCTMNVKDCCALAGERDEHEMLVGFPRCNNDRRELLLVDLHKEEQKIGLRLAACCMVLHSTAWGL